MYDQASTIQRPPLADVNSAACVSRDQFLFFPQWYGQRILIPPSVMHALLKMIFLQQSDNL